MSQKGFSDLDSLLKHIEMEVQDTLNKEVKEKTVDIFKDKIVSEVYEAYTPSMYKRRYDNGGLLDDDNIEAIVDGNTLSVRSTRKDGNKDVASIIEDGVGYTWRYSDIYHMQPYPRPFHKETEKELERNKQHEVAMKQGLRKRGLDVK